MDYEFLADFYDSFIDPDVYETYLELLDQFSVKGELLDIGCGTGSLSLELAKRGYQVKATDLSNEMVAIVHFRAIQEDVDLQVYVYDMLDPLAEEFDVIIASMDVVNHLSSLEDVHFGLTNIYEGLKNHGVFIFDVLSAEYIDLLDGYTEDDEQFHFHWECKKGKEEHSIVHEITVFTEEKDHHITIYEQTHDVSEYITIIERIGFQILEQRSFPERTIFVVQKNLEEK